MTKLASRRPSYTPGRGRQPQRARAPLRGTPAGRVTTRQATILTITAFLGGIATFAAGSYMWLDRHSW